MNASMTVDLDATARRPWLADRFAVVREMLSDLDNLTVAGQQHVMAKILRFLEAASRPTLGRMRARNRLAFNQLFASLRHESARLSPDVASFVHGADGVIALLAALA
jgi:hypothetical protein